jgi:hypothetical protein
VPSRMIRGDELLESTRYMSLSPEDQVFFHHCMLTADDFGLLCLAYRSVRRRFWAKQKSDGYIDKRVAAIESAGLLRTYEFEGVRFGFIPRFRQRLKNFRCNYPMPPPELYQGDGDAVENFTKYKHIFKKQAPSRGEQPPTGNERRPEVEVRSGSTNSKGSEVEAEVPLPLVAGAAPSATDAPLLDSEGHPPEGQTRFAKASRARRRNARTERTRRAFHGPHLSSRRHCQGGKRTMTTTTKRRPSRRDVDAALAHVHKLCARTPRERVEDRLRSAKAALTAASIASMQRLPGAAQMAETALQSLDAAQRELRALDGEAS